jgi:hypothetical protein
MSRSSLLLSTATRVGNRLSFIPASSPLVSSDHSFSAFSIVNSSEMLPALKRSPGLTSWKAGYGGKDVFMFDTYEEMLSSTDLDDEMKQKFPPTLFPTGNEKELGLEQTCVLRSVRRLQADPFLPSVSDFMPIIRTPEDSMSVFSRRAPIWSRPRLLRSRPTRQSRSLRPSLCRSPSRFPLYALRAKTDDT